MCKKHHHQGSMVCSASNATKAYIRNLKMGKMHKEPEITELISALAAGNGAKLIVEACSGQAGPTTLALIAAAHQTGGKVVCVLPSRKELRPSMQAINQIAGAQHNVEFVVGDASTLLLSDYQDADFVLIDCNLEDHEDVLETTLMNRKGKGGGVVVGYNALQGGSWRCDSATTTFLPIGDGLQVLRMKEGGRREYHGCSMGKSKWVKRVDRGTGEEHLFRITSTSCYKHIRLEHHDFIML